MKNVRFESIFADARRSLGYDEIAWRMLRLEWAGVDSDDDLFACTPDGHKASERLMHRLVVAGYRGPSTILVGPDYLSHILRLKADRGVSEPALQAVMASHGHPTGFPLLAMDGRTFQALLTFFEALGFQRPDLSRTWMTADRIAALDEMRRAWRVSEGDMATLLRDYGGGVYGAADLDEFGFNRLTVFFGAKAELLRGPDRHRTVQ